MKNSETKQAKEIQRKPAELEYARELALLVEKDKKTAKPKGWRMAPDSVLKFVLGDKALNITPKFVGSRNVIERCVVALATNRGLMLIGEPGTAKSMLSELLASAISGDSGLTIQGSAGTTEDHIKYSWNYALLLAEGPSERSLVPAPLYKGMREGKIVRFEEITRCPLEVQDTLLSVLSEKVLNIPELPGKDSALFGAVGFNIIATANTRDRGVNEMSAALKRRFNFETLQPIADLQREIELIKRETAKLFQDAGLNLNLPESVLEVLATTFHELRNGRTQEGQALEPLSTVMSVAEAISTGFAAGLHAHYYAESQATAEHLVHGLLGSAIKDSPDDMKKLMHYFNNCVAKRSEEVWQNLYEARRNLV
ncbi:MAG: AAA family ATPase [Candidatus Obscuribacter sp.]|nr:AAA family ATPase [Candidatus Obscuribacter sp.]HMY03013.1 AAA family ATPase [Candidatus Obscuribacter sp.]